MDGITLPRIKCLLVDDLQDNLLALAKPAFRPATTDSRHGWRIWPNLARHLRPTAVNQLWVADITYVRLDEAFIYLAVVLDAFSRKVVGWALRDGRLPLTGCVLLVSGRASFELTQKALMAGLPVLAAVSAPSSLAAELAAESGMTLVGFLRGASMNVYSGAERLTTVSALS